MAKYSYELKKKVVNAYLRGDGGCKYLSKEYGVSSKELVRGRIKAYESLGDAALMRSRKNEN